MTELVRFDRVRDVHERRGHACSAWGYRRIRVCDMIVFVRDHTVRDTRERRGCVCSV